jgi:hypothetical protein
MYTHGAADNQNLRVSTNSQNCANRRPRGKSGFKGVWFDYNCWRAAATLNGKRVHLGRFSSPELAHAAYLEAAKELHGEYAYIDAQ